MINRNQWGFTGKGFRRFRPEQVREMRRLVAEGMRRDEVAKKFATSINTVKDIINGHRYGEVTE